MSAHFSREGAIPPTGNRGPCGRILNFAGIGEFLLSANAGCRTFLQLKKTPRGQVGHCCCCALGLSEHIQDQSRRKLCDSPQRLL
jgi:hypothetical protein